MRVLVVTGISGGHIFPALSFIDTLKKRFPEDRVILVLPRNSTIKKIAKPFYDIEYITISNFRRAFVFGNIVAFWNLLRAFVKSLFIIAEFRPDVIAGFGSIVSVPVVIWAWIFRIKILLHEQNFIPGEANKLLAKISDTIAVSFRETQRYFCGAKGKLTFTGNPIRSDLKKAGKKEALDYFGFQADKFTILLSGGSQGSHRLNTIFPQALGLCRAKHDIQLIHLSGNKDYAYLKEQYDRLKIDYKLFVFLDRMYYAYSACDLIVSRAGATTLTEIISYKIPAVLLPYPFSGSHQEYNAAVLEEKGCAYVFKENSLKAEELASVIESIISDPLKRQKMSDSYKVFISNSAADMLVDEVVKLCVN